MVHSSSNSSGACSIFRQHPGGLTTLFFTELWERFSYYGMRAILMLYMVAAVSDGGLGFPVQQASYIYGTYTMLVYLMSIPGGLVADRLLGTKLSILIGGLIIACGHFSLAFHGLPFFYGGLALIVLGTGLLKPNISTMLGSLYAEGDLRRDGGFSIFYMGINIGAALAPIVCGFLAQSNEFKSFLSALAIDPRTSWHFGFAAAGFGMIFGLAQFVMQRKRLAHAGSGSCPDRTSPPESQQSISQRGGNETRSAFLTREEIRKLGALAVLFVFTVIFWSIYEQGGSSLNLFADRLTDCKVFGWPFPSSWFQSLPAVFVILLAPIFTYIWDRLGPRQPSSPAKFAIGLGALCAGIALMLPASSLAGGGKVSPFWLVGVYFLMVLGELCLSPVGLSTVTKLAPVRFASLTMGLWFVTNALGNFLAGYLGGFFDQTDTARLFTLFSAMAALSGFGTIVLWRLVPGVRSLMGPVK